MTNDLTNDLVTEFLAHGGSISKIPTGKTTQPRTRNNDDTRETNWHRAHDAHFTGDHDEGYRIMDQGQ